MPDEVSSGRTTAAVFPPLRVGGIYMRAFWLLGAMAIAFAPPAVAADSIKIGFVNTFSGPTAAIGNDARNAFELALDHLGRKMAGKPVEVIYEDDQQKPDVGKQKTEKLIQSDHVDFIVGYNWSNVLLASLKPAVDSKTFLIGINAGPSQLAGELCSPYVFSDLVAERPDAGRDGSLHEPEGHQVGVSDRAQLCRRQGQAGRLQEHLQRPGVG